MVGTAALCLLLLFSVVEPIADETRPAKSK
jgi:hypothetical protein